MGLSAKELAPHPGPLPIRCGEGECAGAASDSKGSRESSIRGGSRSAEDLAVGHTLCPHNCWRWEWGEELNGLSAKELAPHPGPLPIRCGEGEGAGAASDSKGSRESSIRGGRSARGGQDAARSPGIPVAADDGLDGGGEGWQLGGIQEVGVKTPCARGGLVIGAVPGSRGLPEIRGVLAGKHHNN